VQPAYVLRLAVMHRYEQSDAYHQTVSLRHGVRVGKQAGSVRVAHQWHWLHDRRGGSACASNSARTCDWLVRWCCVAGKSDRPGLGQVLSTLPGQSAYTRYFKNACCCVAECGCDLALLGPL
jgi:hypothetical protein